jgi:hypothetical protein
VRTSSQPAIEGESAVVQQDELPALSLFYSQGFRVVQGDTCGVTLRNENTRLIAHSKLVQDPPPAQRYTAELYIPLNRLSVSKGKRPYRHTANPDKAQLLGMWRTEFKSNRSRDDCHPFPPQNRRSESIAAEGRSYCSSLLLDNRCSESLLEALCSPAHHYVVIPLK